MKLLEDMINKKTAAIIGVAAAKYMKMKKTFITTHSARADSWVMAGRFGQIDAHEPGMERFR